MPFHRTLFGGGGGGGGAAAANDYLAWQRQQIERLRLEGAERDEFTKTLTSYRRGILADRPGFRGLVNVGSAVQDSDARLAARIGQLDENDPQRIAFNKAQAAEAATRIKARMVISGEEFKVREKVRGIREKIDEDVVLGTETETRLEKMIARLNALRNVRGGRYAGREDIEKSILEAQKRLREWRLKTKQERDALAAREKQERRQRESGGGDGGESGGGGDGGGVAGSGVGGDGGQL